MHFVGLFFLSSLLKMHGQKNKILTMMFKYYGGVFGHNSSPHSPALHWCPCRLSINITMHKCSSANVQGTDVTDKQILMKFDTGEFYEKLLSHFNLQLD